MIFFIALFTSDNVSNLINYKSDVHSGNICAISRPYKFVGDFFFCFRYQDFIYPVFLIESLITKVSIIFF